MSHKFLSTKGKPSAAIFMSGSGSNAEKLLADIRKQGSSATWNPAVIVTDSPEKSKARDISVQWNIPLVELDIREFYRKRGEKRILLKTENGRKIRAEWTEQLRKLIAPYIIDFGILAGFVPLSNITSDFPCLNVHPGDLTVEKNGRRLLVGLHTIPIELAVLAGYTQLRTSVIIAQTYTGSGGEMDSGPILGISPIVTIDMCGHSLEELKTISATRATTRRPPGGFQDRLEEMAVLNQERLKQEGDWVVFPAVVSDFAAGKFSLDDKGTLCYLENSKSVQIQTVVYSQNSKTLRRI